jgi:hypothetical protein
MRSLVAAVEEEDTCEEEDTWHMMPSHVAAVGVEDVGVY